MNLEPDDSRPCEPMRAARVGRVTSSTVASAATISAAPSIERFTRTFREEVLDAYLFESVAEVQGLSDEWLRIYSERRPHEALGSVPPVHFRPRAVLRHESTTLVST
jgi:Integrase core domain